MTNYSILKPIEKLEEQGELSKALKSLTVIIQGKEGEHRQSKAGQRCGEGGRGARCCRGKGAG